MWLTSPWPLPWERENSKMSHKPLPGFGLPGTSPTGLYSCEFCHGYMWSSCPEGDGKKRGFVTRQHTYIICITSYNLCSTLWVSLSHCHWGNWGSERVSDMPKITQLEMTELRLGFSFVWSSLLSWLSVNLSNSEVCVWPYGISEWAFLPH